MSPLGTVVVAWAAVYGYVCTYFCMLYARRRAEREYLHFGLLVGAIGFYALGDVIFISAPTYARQALGAQILAISITAGLPLFVEFCAAVTGAGRDRLLHATYAWAALGLLAEASGRVVVPAREAPPLLAIPGAPPTLAILHPACVAYFCLGWILAAVAIARLWRAARSSFDLRVLWTALLVNVLAAGFDILQHGGFVRAYTVLSHTAILAVFSMSYVLLDRFARTIDALRLRTYELRMSHSELRDTQERLVRREALAAVGELSAVIAHEVRNPIAVIKNAASGLRRSQLREDDRGTLLDILDEETDKLFRLMKDLLAYARPITPNFRTVEVEAVVEGALDRARCEGRSADTAVEVRVDLDGAPRTIEGDPTLLENALANLIDNALQAMPQGGRLSIRGHWTSLGKHEAIELLVTDTGAGMEASIRDKARVPFFTTRPRGTGLGLPIVERIVKNHGGAIELGSSPGEGTQVIVRLPRHRISSLPPLPPGLVPLTPPAEPPS